MNRNFSTLVVAAFALILTAYSPAFAQYYTVGGNCPGGQCYSAPAPATAAANPTACAPCARTAATYAQTATFAPFGGFFRNLFGGCRFTSSTLTAGPCAQNCERNGARGFCNNGQCLADPVNREFVPGEPVAKQEPETADAETCDAVEPCESCAECDGETCDGETCDAETCDAETCEPCDAVQTTEIERRLLNVINSVRERFGRQRCAADRNLFGWARYNSALQARYCRLGHFSGHSYEIAGEGYLTPEACVNGWIGSAPHNVILFGSSWTRVGVSVYQGQNGRYYWTATFGR